MTTLALQLTAPGSFARFCEFLYPRPSSLPASDPRHKKNKPLQPFHYEWANGIAMYDEYMVLGPRGHFKSTICSQAQSIWRLAINPDARIGIISNDGDEAKKDLRYIKGHLSRNRELVGLFPHLAPSNTLPAKVQRDGGKFWREGQITICGREDIGEASIMTTGVYGGFTGPHFEHVILNDIVDFKNSRTEYQREKLKDWLAETIEGTLMSGGTLTYIGTRYHWQDVYGDKLEAELRDKHIVSSAINYDEDGNEVALFPDLIDLDGLHAKRRRMGTTAFNSQMQNDTAAMKGSKFKPHYFQYWKELPPTECRMFYIGIDTSMGKTITSDFTGWCVGIIDERDGNHYILEADHERLNLDARRALVRRLNEKYPLALRIGIEAVGFAGDFVTDMQKEIPKCTPIDQQYSKEIRAERIEPYFERGMVWLGPDGMHQKLEQELLMFPEGKYDDMFDALELFMRLGEGGSGGEGLMEVGEPLGQESWNRRDGWSSIS